MEFSLGKAGEPRQYSQRLFLLLRNSDLLQSSPELDPDLDSSFKEGMGAVELTL